MEQVQLKIDKKQFLIGFDQAYATTSEEYGGSGLGLTLSKQLIELHKGSIEVESNIGQGSEFTIVLPVNQ